MKSSEPRSDRGSRGWRPNLPWIDGLGALVVGVLVLALLDPLSRFYALPRGLLTFTGVANVAYSLPGITISLLPRGARSVRRVLLMVLIGANLTWTLVCIALTVRAGAGASVFGLAHLLGEGVYVAALAALEWRHRRLILGDANASA